MLPMGRLPLLAAILLAAGSACSQATEPEPLRGHAAASLRDLFEELGDLHEASTGRPVVLTTGGSNLIARQVLAGAHADVFASASPVETADLVEAGHMHAEDARELFANTLVLVAPAGSDVPEGRSLAELLGDDPDLRLAIAHPEAVPAGRYARTWLEARGQWQAVEPRLVTTLDVRAALGAVGTGAVGLGLVYRTDATASEEVRVLMEVPRDEVAAVYGGGVLADTELRAEAEAFLSLCTGEDPAGAPVLERHGFALTVQEPRP